MRIVLLTLGVLLLVSCLDMAVERLPSSLKRATTHATAPEQVVAATTPAASPTPTTAPEQVVATATPATAPEQVDTSTPTPPPAPPHPVDGDTWWVWGSRVCAICGVTEKISYTYVVYDTSGGAGEVTAADIIVLHYADGVEAFGVHTECMLDGLR